MNKRAVFQQSQKAFLLALSLMTRFPVGNLKDINDQDSGRSALFYPVIGLLIGVFLYLPILMFPNTPHHFLAIFSVTLWVIITGGLHLDGLADSADGWLGGGFDKERTLRIMKDPVVGAAGSIAIACLLVFKFSSITALIETQQTYLLLLAPVMGRLMVLFIFHTTQYANTSGMANAVVENFPKNLSIPLLSIGLLFFAFLNIWGLVCVLLAFLFLRRLMIKRLGGFTGDTLGATIEISEILFIAGAILAV